MIYIFLLAKYNKHGSKTLFNSKDFDNNCLLQKFSYIHTHKI